MAEVTGMTPEKIAQEITNVKSYVDGGLSEKADKSQVTSDLSKKADITQVTSDLSKKADITQVTSDLSKKADITYVDSLSPLKSFAGTGSPEGKITAPVGTIYTDTASTNGAIRWIKTSGTGNTGWEVEYGDTGGRKIISSGSSVISGEIVFRRQGNSVTARLVNIIPKDPNSSLQNLGTAVPLGFRPVENQIFGIVGNTGGLRGHIFAVYNRSVTYIQRTGTYANNPIVEGGYDGQVTWATNDSWPTTLPGTPA